MDSMTASKLQKNLTELGHKNGFAPPKSQDPADALLHELFVANVGRSIFDKRYKKALEHVQHHDDQRKVEQTVEEVAKSHIAKSVTVLQSEHYTLNLAVRGPATRFDKIAARNALAKAGVKEDVIDKAFAAAETHNSPAKVFTVTLT